MLCFSIFNSASPSFRFLLPVVHAMLFLFFQLSAGVYRLGEISNPLATPLKSSPQAAKEFLANKMTFPRDVLPEIMPCLFTCYHINEYAVVILLDVLPQL